MGPQWGMSWVYDGFGNRTAQQVVKGSVPVQSVSVDMATNRISNWSYDANGNATSIPGVGSITYDASNRVKTVGSETYEYDPSNKRIWKNDTYTFWGGKGERVGTYSVQLMQYLPEGQTVQQYQLSFVKVTEDWYFGGRRLQVLDRLGSANGTFYPYGEERTSAVGNPADKFATYHRDGTGLDYADQRYYSPGSGRFLTPDPLMLFRNGYTYTEGDPVNGIDPDGLLTIIVSGTGEQNAEWSQPGSEMWNTIRDYFGETDACMFVFDWSTSVVDTIFGDAMFGAARGLGNLIDDAIKACPNQPLNIVGYSHGGNVALAYSNLSGARFIDNLVTLGTPSRIDFDVNSRNVGNFCAVSRTDDLLQFAGAHPLQLVAYEIVIAQYISVRRAAIRALFRGNISIFDYFLLSLIGSALDSAAVGIELGTRVQPGANNYVILGGPLMRREAHTTVRTAATWNQVVSRSDWRCQPVRR